MQFRGLLYDLARGRRAHTERLRYTIDALAELGYNALVINLEHRFEFPSCPGLAPPGSLSASAARDLVEYGASRGVEVIGQPNVIGHCEGLLSTQRYSHLAADPYTQRPWGGYEQLNLELPEARELVTRMMDDVCRAFPGKWLHIGADEIRRMEYLFPGEKDRQARAIREQLDFVFGLARRAGRRIMMWGDIPLLVESVMESLPRDVVICDWHYEPAGSRATLERYRDRGFTVVSCPAVVTYDTFCVDVDGTHQNITRMVGDARELKLEGFLLTTWENDFGSGFDLCWPWIALASAVDRGERVGDIDEFLSRVASDRYGVDGAAFVRLLRLLDRDFRAALGLAEGRSNNPLRVLRKMLFRGADTQIEPMRITPAPPAGATLTESTPFLPWLYLRATLTDDSRRTFRRLADEAESLAKQIEQSARRRKSELFSLITLAGALGVLAERLEILTSAQSTYHAAAVAQQSNPAEFRHHLGATANALERLRPGIAKLKSLVRSIDDACGLDPEELLWLDIQSTHLAEHIDALRRFDDDGDSLLEFGEFLRRPANITPRLTWR